MDGHIETQNVIKVVRLKLLVNIYLSQLDRIKHWRACGRSLTGRHIGTLGERDGTLKLSGTNNRLKF